ncbi:hypothetical protein BC628DRAFT_1416390 [Trametes gibbosa]|uniref:C2H2-type domain-containing protein n=1 Tax=Trametes gibbosa TaxID=160864 RepID=A0A6G6FQB8_9APHY|nr:hypothetical protein BC628DRAFT_1416390 [Trametes gibbosa]QIE48489.1 hypothetical protein [Trametes gibbosa]
MDSLVSQPHPSAYAHNQFAIQVDAHTHAFPPSSASSSSSSAASPSMPRQHAYSSASGDVYDHPRYSAHSLNRFPPSSSSSQHAQHQQSSPSLQIQTATPAPHEHDPEEQTAHPSRHAAFPPSSSSSTPEHIEHDDMLMPPQQSIADALTEGSGYGGLSRALTLQERELLEHLDRLKFFLATAPSRWNSDPSSSSSAGLPFNPGMAGMGVPAGHPHSAHPALNRFLLPNQEYVSCVLWGGLYHITGTDIVRALVFRFEAFGRPVRNMKKFEEGVFSDLRNLKPGVDACLEEPKSPFLDLLFKYQCIRTQKKQKVFYWFSVPHDRLFLDALERDLKREKMGHEPTTVVVGEPALSFSYDPKRSLYEQFSKVHGAREGEGELEAAVRRADEARGSSAGGSGGEESEDRARSVASTSSDAEHSASEADETGGEDAGAPAGSSKQGVQGAAGKGKKKPSALSGPNSPFFPMFSLFEGSPTYKQRRKKVPKGRKSSPTSDSAHHPLAQAHALAHLNGGVGVGPEYPSAYGGMVVQPPQGFREPHLDRFGRDVVRLSAGDMFGAGARGEFGANPDIVVTQKERQRRAMEAQVPYLAGLSGPGVAGSSAPAAMAPSAAVQELDMVYGQGTTASALASSMDYASSQQQPQQQQQQQQQQYGQPQAMHPRPQLEQRHTYPMVDFAPHAPLRTGTDPSPTYALAPVGQQLPTGWTPAAEPSGAGVVGGLMEAPRTKAFVCPLFSCGRMFKRMEHLRRHLRTHTLERPFQCEQCQKRFSRSDNLAQHVRTHDRRAAQAAAMGGMGLGIGLGLGEMGMGMAVGVPDGGEADAEDELEADDLDGELRYMSGVNGITSVRMCEVEVQGQVHEVQGDEEGLLTTTGPVALTGGAVVPPATETADADGPRQIFYDNAGQILRASPEMHPYLPSQQSPDSQWATIPSTQQSPAGPASAFSTTTVTTGSASGLHLANTPAAPRLDASYHTAGAMGGDYVTSISAPSHKLTFDHTALYPPELALNGPGPVRRHRSATPSIARYGESIRRPYSAALSDSGNGAVIGATSASAPSSRSYHPYAMAGHHPVSHSAQSSPMAYTVPLGSANGYDAPVRHHGGHSRSSSSGQLQDQMRQMLSIEQMDAGSMAAQYAAAVSQQHQHQQESQAYAGMYRTDSPMQFGAVGDAAGAGYEMEMAHQHPHQHQHQPTAYTVALADQYAAQQQHQHQQQQRHPQQQHQQQPEYYPHPHHSL